MSAPDPSASSSSRLAQTAERLRLTLPLLAKHGSDCGPQSYALWYRYVEGTLEALTDVLEPFVREGKRLTDEQTGQLYVSMLEKAEEGAISRMRDNLLQVLSRTAESTRAASADAASFSAVVQRESAVLRDDAEGLPALARIVAESDGFARSLTALSGELDERRAEVLHLRDELEAVRREAASDGLTGLYSRRTFDSLLGQLFDPLGAGGRSFCLVMLDVDHFKSINDTFGHVFGDRVLRAIADTLKAHVKGKDSVSRYGGEEFAILLPDTPAASARVVADHLRLAVAGLKIRYTGSTDKPIPGITVSCGVASRRSADTPVALVERADQALYKAKREGRNRVVVEEPTQQGG